MQPFIFIYIFNINYLSLSIYSIVFLNNYLLLKSILYMTKVFTLYINLKYDLHI